MPTRLEHMSAHPTFPWLAADDLPALAALLAKLRWLRDSERVTAVQRAGQGNMNLTLRVTTNQRTLIVKQARPWVEKYDQIAAPWDRVAYEHGFYQRVADWPAVASRMPQLLGFDAAARMLAIEDLGHAADYTFVYSGTPIPSDDLTDLARYLRALHDESNGSATADFANRDMRALNHEHMYRFPLDAGNGLPLDTFEPGLSRAAGVLQQDDKYRALVTETGDRYLADGDCLQHGDFFPGSFLRTTDGPRVIDPEFCYYGDREFDLGVLVAHLVLAQQATSVAHLLQSYGDDAFDSHWLARYAAVEVMRRLIGVAQLPIAPTTDGWRAAILEQSRQAMLTQSLEPLCNA